MSKSNVRRSRSVVLGVVAGAIALSACATPTPYRPVTGQGSYRTGYFDEQIEANRFRVGFSGNSLTSRETVERYLLFRAAQLTLERGFDHFTLVDRDTERKSRTQIIDDPFYGPGWGGGFGGWGGWGPRWRYYRPGFGWGGWGGWGGGFGGGFGGGITDVRQIDRYEAQAEILTARGPKPQDVRSFDARQVVENLGPNIVLPEERRR